MGKFQWTRLSALVLVVVALAAAACGGGNGNGSPTATPTAGGQQPGGSEWDQIVAAAQSETLHIVTHPGADYEALVAAFSAAYPNIRVEHLGVRPSEIAPRVITEQQNNIFAWDVWTTSTSNMNNVVKPTGGFQSMEPFLVLDEVKEPSNWRPGEILYTSDDNQILIHSMNLSQGIRVNTAKLQQLGVELNTFEDFLNPALEGRIGIRELTGEHGSSLQMTGLLKEFGEEWVRNLLTSGNIAVNDNAGQLAQGIMQAGGQYAITIGAANEVIDQCWVDGGCQEIEMFPQNNYALARGIAVFRNAPSPNAAKVFINWFLSQEGQQEFVDIWGEVSGDGGHSVRVDVDPAPGEGHQRSFPDYDNFDNYSLQGTDFGAPLMQQIQDMWREIRG